ncbi:MAG: N-acetyltransferase [Negativicutes bacterium]|nr:N-acetyltransferase [Negativicutes bacterium]
MGERIYLRGLEKTDLKVRPEWFNDPDINHTLLMKLPISDATTSDWYTRILPLQNKTRVDLSICDKQTDRVIGMTGLLQIDLVHRHSQFYITIGEKEYWGKRFPDEVIPRVLWLAFVQYGLNKVYLWTINVNARARHVYERNGFRNEAIMREHYFCRGKLQDIHQHAILRRDWEIQMHQTGNVFEVMRSQ